MQSTIIMLVEELAVSLGGEFKVMMLGPLILWICWTDRLTLLDS